MNELMRRRQLAAVIMASALITFDGTATTVALPAIGRDLSLSIARLQWLANAPLLVLAALLLPAGALADRFGRVRLMRIGLIGFVTASCAAAAGPSDVWVISARFLQGAASALVLPAALAMLRAAYADADQRARMFGVWAAWTGVAGAVGPLMAGAIVDLWSWRLVFVSSAAAGLIAVMLLERESSTSTRSSTPVPARATVALSVVVGAVAYLLMQTSTGGTAARIAVPTMLLIAGTAVLVRDPHRQMLLPRELLAARNCVSANATTFALYFGLFGFSFVIVLYVQQLLQYSALWAAVVLLPISILLLFAERLGRFTTVIGTRWVIVAGALAAALGIAWIGSSPHPVPFWSHLIAGTTLFGFGLSLAVSALTHAAVAGVPEACAGAASGLNHAVVRAAGLVSVAVLGSLAAPGISNSISVDGMQRALMLCAVIVGAGGVLGGAFVRDHDPGGLPAAN
jgi:MFS family permease